MQQNAGLCLCIQSDSLYLFIGELSPFMITDIKEYWLLFPAIFAFKGRIMPVCLSSFGFLA